MNAWPVAEPLGTARSQLEPLSVQHAEEMTAVLADAALYEYTGGNAPTTEELASRYAKQVVGQTADGREGWLNWIIRRRDSGNAVGFTQATLAREHEGLIADVAWVIAPQHQGNGFATEASRAMCDWLLSGGVSLLVAYIHPANLPSIGVAKNLGMAVTDVVVDGESRWELPGTRQ
ncbi:MAG: GNAT family N-acetyltransferase [Micrococcaceae bacterium]